MRRLEVTGTGGLLLYVFHLFFPFAGHEVIFAFLLCITAVVIACHVWFEGYRWQMAPAYFLAFGLVLYECMHRLWGFQAPYLAGVAALLFDLAAIGLSILLPVFKLPAPSGPYKVGTQIRHIVDGSRRDPFADHPDFLRLPFSRLKIGERVVEISQILIRPAKIPQGDLALPASLHGGREIRGLLR